MTNVKKQLGILSIPVLVAALGYFVDIYDLLLFGIIRVPSLHELGLTDLEIRNQGETILTFQMTGLLLGGIFWGVLGDKRGRLSVLFGSILLYSTANILNGFVQNVHQYAWVRFAAGLGLAGELGAGITLVSELIPKEKRGVATSLVAGLGLTGAVVAFFIKQNFHWRTCYFIGGGLGVLLLLLRISVFESGMFHEVKKLDVQRGNFFMLFKKGERFKRYLLSILIGLPTWFVIGVLVTFSKEFGKEMHIAEPIDAGKSIMFAYAGISIGDILIGFVSQWFKSRKKALYVFYAITALFMILYFTVQYNGSAMNMYIIAAGLGFGTGFWAIFVTMGAEQFGTNLRATAATTVPNMVRGMLPLVLMLFQFLRNTTGDYITGAWITGVIVMSIGVVATILIQETYGRDLNFIEE
ncbi:MFS transporter [Deminuibacter soli]|uniref:MFS transporter n=1 Tax=Deminuibacter soli TaxID=2291815 RepID=A0A3E1NDH5_9BACT|nr:MFS transporter [Deminuibacter soli]RFM26019.1 MFS transporter [Deminuibacter soli]